MKLTRLTPRAVALALSFTFALPDPALALRIESAPQSAGAEELTRALSPAAGAEEQGSYERLLTDPKHHNPEQFTYIVHSISPRMGKPEGWIPTPEELQSARVLSASLIHRDQKRWIVNTHRDQGFILSVPDENIFWVSPTDLGMSVRDFLTEQKTLGLLHQEKKGVLPPDELIRKSQEFQRINDLLSQNEILIEGTHSRGRKISVAGVFLKEESGPPLSFEIQTIRSNLSAWAKKHRLPIVFIQRPTKPKPAGAEEKTRREALARKWDEGISRFQEEFETLHKGDWWRKLVDYLTKEGTVPDELPLPKAQLDRIPKQLKQLLPVILHTMPLVIRSDIKAGQWREASDGAINLRRHALHIKQNLQEKTAGPWLAVGLPEYQKRLGELAEFLGAWRKRFDQLAAAGMEESRVFRIKRRLAEEILHPRMAAHARLSTDTRTARWALVQGAPGEAYLHLHIDLRDELGERILTNGLLFPVWLEKERLQFGFPLAEVYLPPASDPDLGRHFVRLEGLAPPAVLERLMSQVYDPNLWLDSFMEGRQLSESDLKKALQEPGSFAYVLGVSVTPGEEGLFMMDQRKSWDRHPDHRIQWPEQNPVVTFARADRLSAAGAEERDWSDIRWFWDLEPWQREQLLHGVPGQAGFFLNGWQHKQQANPGIAGMVEDWPDIALRDPGAVWWHVEQEDFFKHLLEREFSPSAAPWAVAFRESVGVIRGSDKNPDKANNRLFAYLTFLSRLDTRRPFISQYGQSLRQFSAAMAEDFGKYKWGRYNREQVPYYERILGLFFKAHSGETGELGTDLQDLLSFDSIWTIAYAGDLMEKIFTDPRQGPRFTEQLILFMMSNPSILQMLHRSCDQLWWPQLTPSSLQTAQGWLAEGTLPELDLFFIILNAVLAEGAETTQDRILAEIRLALEQGVFQTSELPLLLKLWTMKEAPRKLLSEVLTGIPADPKHGRTLSLLLFQALRDENPDPVINLARATKDPETRDALLAASSRALKSPDVVVRNKTIELLSQMTDPRAVDLIVSAYNDPVEQVRWEAVQALGRNNPAEGIPLFVRALEDPAPSVREEALKTLAMLDNRWLLPHFIRAAEDLDPSVHEAAIQGFMRIEPAVQGFEAAFVESLLAFTRHVDWLKEPPQRAEIEAFRSKILRLPPAGGKIPNTLDAKGRLNPVHSFGPLYKIAPTWTMEEQVGTVLKARQAGLLESGYVHQLTVQGKLPDEFKYVALALILSSPYRHDWTEPMFNATWGTVAPLVHDGGAVELDLNPAWEKVEGRTDFLQRVVMVYDPKTQPELERMEQDRLLLEARAYQRLALALHAAKGTAPRAEEVPGGIPPDLYEKLSAHWKKFRQAMDQTLGAFSGELGGERFDLNGLVRVRWFLGQPVEVEKWPGPRWEAPWPPIQKELLMLNRFAEKTKAAAVAEEADLSTFDALRLQVIKLLKTTSDEIDQDLGLAPPLYSPAAGMEELADPANSGSAQVVIGPSAFARVPGLRAAVAALRQAGLENRLIILPDETIPEPELTDQLSALAVKVLAAGAEETLLSYATASDRVAEKFKGMVSFRDIAYLRREPAALRLLLPQILRDLGLPAAQSQAVTEELLSAAGVEEAA